MHSTAVSHPICASSRFSIHDAVDGKYAPEYWSYYIATEPDDFLRLDVSSSSDHDPIDEPDAS